MKESKNNKSADSPDNTQRRSINALKIVKYILCVLLVIVLWLVTAAVGIVGLCLLVYGIYLLIGRGDTAFALYMAGIGVALCGVCALLVFASLSAVKFAKKSFAKC